MKFQLIAFLLVSMTAFGQTQERAHKELFSNATVDTTMSDYLPTVEKAHPNAKQLMSEEFYFSPIEETAPFGSDDGADTYAGFKDWRKEHKSDNPKDFLVQQIEDWGYPTFDINETNLEKLKPYLAQTELGNRYMSGIDASIVAIAFGQLYLEGTIDKDFKETAKTAIKRELIPELLVRWGKTYKVKRETQLRKMLTILNNAD